MHDILRIIQQAKLLENTTRTIPGGKRLWLSYGQRPLYLLKGRLERPNLVNFEKDNGSTTPDLGGYIASCRTKFIRMSEQFSERQ